MLKIFWDENLYPEETAALRLQPNDDSSLIIGVDITAAARAAIEVLQARRAGIPVVAYLAGADPLEAMLARVGAQIAGSADMNLRKTHLAALRDGQLTVDGVQFANSAPMSRDAALAANFICRMADAVATFTQGEAARWSAILGKQLRRTVFLKIPQMHRRPQNKSGITVYAPSTPRAKLGFLDAALQLHERAATFITAENALDVPATPVVITPEWWRPARGLALASAGFRVVCPSRSAVATRARAFEYAELSSDSLAAALDAAASADNVEMLWEPAATWEFAAAVSPERPLVSIIVRTYDRPALLARAIDSIVRQTYPEIEIVVVNNGGPDVHEIVRSACGTRPFRYVAHPARCTIGTASNLGARAATGSFIGYLDDDDLLYPDHVALAVETLERTGADLAYSDCVGEYAVVQDGRKSVIGVGIYLDREFNRDSLYTSNFAPIHSIVHRRELFDRFGYFDETLPVTDDWDLWLRAAHGARFVHVGRPTCEYSWRIDAAAGNMTVHHQQDFVDCYKRITEKWASQVAGRADIMQGQSQTLAMQQHRVSSLTANPSSAYDVLLAPLVQNSVQVSGMLDEAV